MKKIRVVVADDHPVVREGLASVINRQPGLTVCAEAHSTVTVIACVEQERPDALLLDLLLDRQDGIALIRDLLVRQPGLRILVISIQAEQLSARRCLEAGAAGYVSKTRPMSEIVAALCAVLDLPSKLPVSAPEGRNESWAELTKAESEAALLAFEGLDNQQIADRLGISVAAVKVRLHGAYRKLNVQSRTQLAALMRG